MSDFNKDSSNNAQDTRGFGGDSGLSAGVESGLSSVEKLSRGAVDAQQKTHGDNFMRTQMDEPAGKKGGKNFTFRT